ncbi:MAG: hypothetical protein JWL83_3944 [Actinomycetia bacterium]|nr:hypothetical protein [Actinomycetes bacterium]
MTAPVDPNVAGYADWLRALAADARFGADDRLGTANLIDRAARRRAAAAIEEFEVMSLARPLVPHASVRGDGRPGFALEVFTVDGDEPFGSDHLELDCHGSHNTHLDALNHMGFDASWYGGRPVGAPDPPSVADLAEHGLVTRAVLVDIARARDCAWVDPSAPVTGADIERALAQGKADLAPGDGLLVYMGRDRFERAGHPFTSATSRAPRPGIGRDGARWIAESGVSVLGWDFLDAVHPDEPQCTVHLLQWAIGLVLIDNCALGDAAHRLDQLGRATGALVVAPLRLSGATGCTVNPMLIV